MQRVDCLFGGRFNDVRNHDVSGIGSVYCHVDNGSDMVAVNMFDPEACHEPAVADRDLFAVNNSRDSVPADFCHIAYPFPVQLFSRR